MEDMKNLNEKEGNQTEGKTKVEHKCNIIQDNLNRLRQIKLISTEINIKEKSNV